MSALEAFLNPVTDLQEITLTFDRFLDENKKPATIKLRALTAEQDKAIIKSCKKREIIKGVPTESLDTTAYLDNLILNMIVEPNFRDEKFVKAMGKMSPIDAIKARFTASEYNRITAAVNELIGTNTIFDEAKN